MLEEQIAPNKYVDLDKTIAEQQGGLLKKLPYFVIAIIKKIIRQDQANKYFNNIEHLKDLEYVRNLMLELEMKIDVTGLENLPDHKKSIFVCNHPFGFADAIAVSNIVANKYGYFKIIANDAIMFIPQIHQFIAAVNVFDGSTKEALKALELIYTQDIPLINFPAGVVSRKINGKIEDFQWQKSFIRKAVEHERDIVPIFCHGKNSALFYNIYIIRSFLRIKTNIELMLLPREFFRKKGSTIKLTIGKPIPYTIFDKSKSYLEWAQWVKRQVYELAS